MRILGISGSNRRDGNSFFLLREMFKDMPTTTAKIVQIAELEIRPCELCFEQCAKTPFECTIQDDFRMIFEEMKSAYGIAIACPFYFYVPSKFQAFLERTSCLDYYSIERHGKKFSPLRGKPCALIAVSASGSSFNSFQLLHHLQEFALMLEMRPLITNSWPFIGLSAKCGLEKGAALKEKETMKQAKNFAKALVREIEDKEGK